MGENPSPPQANLFLYTKERDFVNRLVEQHGESTIIEKAHGFKFNARFIDDLISPEMETFRISSEDYGLQLVTTGHDQSVKFLGVSLKCVPEKGRVEFQVFDKQKAFPMLLVRFPHALSCLPRHVRIGTVVTMLVRCIKYTTQSRNFLDEVKTLFEQFKRRGYDRDLVHLGVQKFVQRQIESSYRQTTKREIEAIINETFAQASPASHCQVFRELHPVFIVQL